MLKMRLQRVGRKNDPSYRIVVTDSRTGPKSNKHVDLLGSYSPKMNHVQLDGERAKDWINKGVQLSDTVHNLLINEKVIEGKKVNVLPKKSPIAKEQEETTEASVSTEAVEETVSEEVKEEVVKEEAPETEEKPTEEEKADEEPVEAEGAEKKE